MLIIFFPRFCGKIGSEKAFSCHVVLVFRPRPHLVREIKLLGALLRSSMSIERRLFTKINMRVDRKLRDKTNKSN
jgi:hypothetical protein